MHCKYIQVPHDVTNQCAVVMRTPQIVLNGQDVNIQNGK